MRGSVWKPCHMYVECPSVDEGFRLLLVFPGLLESIILMTVQWALLSSCFVKWSLSLDRCFLSAMTPCKFPASFWYRFAMLACQTNVLALICSEEPDDVEPVLCSYPYCIWGAFLHWSSITREWKVFLWALPAEYQPKGPLTVPAGTNHWGQTPFLW